MTDKPGNRKSRENPVPGLEEGLSSATSGLRVLVECTECFDIIDLGKAPDGLCAECADDLLDDEVHCGLCDAPVADEALIEKSQKRFDGVVFCWDCFVNAA